MPGWRGVQPYQFFICIQFSEGFCFPKLFWSFIRSGNFKPIFRVDFHNCSWINWFLYFMVNHFLGPVLAFKVYRRYSFFGFSYYARCLYHLPYNLQHCLWWSGFSIGYAFDLWSSFNLRFLLGYPMLTVCVVFFRLSEIICFSFYFVL